MVPCPPAGSTARPIFPYYKCEALLRQLDNYLLFEYMIKLDCVISLRKFYLLARENSLPKIWTIIMLSSTWAVFIQNWKIFLTSVSWFFYREAFRS